MTLGLASCKKNDWKGTSMKSWGTDVSSGGFIAETSNYLYYVNGYASYGGDNSFGVPVKGALMAVEKSSIASGNVKTEIVVPKLFVSTDYKGGVFVYDGYVYYGTPSTNKTGSGEIASSEMTFTKTKLDGTDTQTFFTVSSHATEYRFIEFNDKVMLVYYDADDKALYAYDTTSKNRATIAKTDSTTKDKYESLGSYIFTDSQSDCKFTVIYSATVYSENYYSAAASQDGYSRATALYNKVYAYTVGDTVAEGNEFAGKCILNGESEDITYSLTKVMDGANASYLFYSAKTATAKTTKHAIDLADNSKTYDIVNDVIGSSECLFVSLDEVYTVITEGDGEAAEGEVFKMFIVKTTLLEKDNEIRIKVAEGAPNVKIFAKRVENGKNYLYYFDSTNQLVRVETVDSNSADTEFNVPERISEGSVSTGWYAPEFITIDGAEYLFYCDNTAKGMSYVKYVKLTGAIVEGEDTDDDGVNDSFFIEGQKFLAKISNEDYASMAAVDLNELKTISYDKEKGEFVGEEEIINARASYNALKEGAKEAYGESNYAKLCNAEKALAAAKLLYKLDGIINYEICDQQTKDAYKAAYEDAKAIMEEIKTNTDVLNFIENNMKYNYYEKATTLFA